MRSVYMFARTVFAALLTLAFAASANASSVVIVPGTSNPWLAGMPNGTTALIGDVAPNQSPVEVAVTAGDVLWFFASGTTDHCPSFGCGAASAEGDAGEGPWSHLGRAEHGISDGIAPIDGL